MNSTTLRLARPASIALAIATLLQAPRLARAETQQPAPEPPPPPVQPPGEAPPYQGPPPVYAPGPYAPGPYAPGPYAPQPYTPAPKGPKRITQFDPNAPAPEGYTKVSQKRKGLIIGGAVTFGVTYGISLFVAAINEDVRSSDSSAEDLSSLAIPVAGPFLQLAKTDASIGRLSLIQLGLAQTLGAAMLIYGLTNPKTVLLRNDLVTMSVSPMIGNGASGLMAVGSF